VSAKCRMRKINSRTIPQKKFCKLPVADFSYSTFRSLPPPVYLLIDFVAVVLWRTWFVLCIFCVMVHAKYAYLSSISKWVFCGSLVTAVAVMYVVVDSWCDSEVVLFIWVTFAMFLYNLTLQRATGITHAIHGNFSGTKQQEVVVSRGKILELLRPDPNTGKVYVQLTVEVFGVIRALMPFRLTGGTKGDVLRCLLQRSSH